MKFTFVIPALNEENYLGECLSSLKAQLLPAEEIIVVDNGSTDKTAAIAQKLGAKVIKETKRGLSHARNAGAKVAKGDILCFVDADGIVSPGWIKNAKKVLENDAIDAVSGLVFYRHHNPIKFLWYNSYLLPIYFYLFLVSFFNRPFIVGNNTAIRKHVFWELGGFEPVVAEDYWFSQKFVQKGYNGKTAFNMPIYYSARGFDKTGYLRTLLFWIKSTFHKISQEGYSYKSKKIV